MMGQALREGRLGKRHVSVRLFRMMHTKSGAKRRATRLGGIPAGSLEVTWEVYDLGGLELGRLEVQRGVSLS